MQDQIVPVVAAVLAVVGPFGRSANPPVGPDDAAPGSAPA